MEQISYRLIEQLRKKESHIRELAKRININHMTVLRKINQLEKKNVVDFRKEGKNKVYFLKKSLEAEQFLIITEHFRLLELIKKHPRLRSIVEKLKTIKADMAIIFGSYAKGHASSKSDIDLYVNTTNKKIKEQLELLDSKLNIKIGNFDKQNLLIKEIIKNHVIIKGVEKYYELIH